MVRIHSHHDASTHDRFQRWSALHTCFVACDSRQIRNAVSRSCIRIQTPQSSPPLHPISHETRMVNIKFI